MNGLQGQAQLQSGQFSGNVQSSQADQGISDGQMQQQQQQQQQEQQQAQEPQQSQVSQESQQPIDYEKSFRNLEKDYTKKAQRLKELEKLEGWAQFEKETGITAEQALRQLEQYKTQTQPAYASTQPYQQPHPYQQPQPTYDIPPTQASYDDPRVAQLEQQLNELTREQQIAKLRQKFPQFDEVYPDVINLADSQGVDLETAFGRLMVERWDEFQNRAKQDVVNTIRAKGLKAVEPSTSPDESGEQDHDLTPEEIEAAKALGVDPKEYAQMKETQYLAD